MASSTSGRRPEALSAHPRLRRLPLRMALQLPADHHQGVVEEVRREVMVVVQWEVDLRRQAVR